MSDALIDLEERGWQALSSRDIAFCEEWLDAHALLVVPGMVIDRATFLAALTEEKPWSGHQIAEARMVPFTSDCVALLYEVTAQRVGQPDYIALITSVYVHADEKWRLLYHQQTPSPTRGHPTADLVR